MNREPQDVATRLDRHSIPEPNTGCVLWLGALGHNGYGRFSYFTAKGQPQRHSSAHRASWELLNGPVPAGLQLDHRCNTRACINPYHLRPVTPRENQLRSTSVSAKNAAKINCLNGHPLSGDNLKIAKDGSRHCRECLRVWNRTNYARKKDAG